MTMTALMCVELEGTGAFAVVDVGSAQTKTLRLLLRFSAISLGYVTLRLLPSTYILWGLSLLLPGCVHVVFSVRLENRQ